MSFYGTGIYGNNYVGVNGIYGGVYGVGLYGSGVYGIGFNRVNNCDYYRRDGCYGYGTTFGYGRGFGSYHDGFRRSCYDPYYYGGCYGSGCGLYW